MLLLHSVSAEMIIETNIVWWLCRVQLVHMCSLFNEFTSNHLSDQVFGQSEIKLSVSAHSHSHHAVSDLMDV